MKICHCILGLTNPDACKFCNNGITGISTDNRTTYKWFANPYDQIIKKTVVKEYDKDGNLIRETTTECN